MTPAVEFLMRAAEDAQAYAMRKWEGYADRGQYEGMAIARALFDAREAVKQEEAAKKQDAA